MKNLVSALIGTLAVGAALPAVAGPDWQLIEQGRKAKLAHVQQMKAGAGATGTDYQRDRMMKECAEMMKT